AADSVGRKQPPPALGAASGRGGIPIDFEKFRRDTFPGRGTGLLKPLGQSASRGLLRQHGLNAVGRANSERYGRRGRVTIDANNEIVAAGFEQGDRHVVFELEWSAILPDLRPDWRLGRDQSPLRLEALQAEIKIVGRRVARWVVRQLEFLA